MIAGLGNFNFLMGTKGRQGSEGAEADASAADGQASPFAELLGQEQETNPQASELVPPASNPGLGGLPPMAERLAPVGVPSPAGTGLAKATPMVENMDSVDLLTKRVVWSEFLRKMKDDLGITAEDVLQAFQSLSDEDLAKPPAESVDKLVLAMGLTPQDSQIAKIHFQELIQKTQPRSLGEELRKNGGQIQLTLMSQRDLNRKKMATAVDRMNENFFPKNRVPVEQMRLPKVQENGEGTESAVAPAVTDNFQDMAVATETLESTDTSALPARASESKGAFEIPQELQATDTKTPAPDADAVLKKFTAGQAPLPQSISAGGSSMPTLETEAAPKTSVPSRLSESVPMAPTGLFTDSANLGNSSSDGDDDDYTSDASYLTSGAGIGKDAAGLKGAGQEFRATMNQAGQPMAVQDLVQNAQVMVRDGGGEMKVTLKPEGLGEVAMKVSVEHGKVNVQMITESDEAKKLIERQLGDLKAQLGHNNLQLEGIKIDTATDLGKQLQQQYQDAQRNMAQQTLEQYRQDHQGWRRSFYEAPTLKSYKGQFEAPRDVQAPSGSSRRMGSRRLDLVA
ncbi:MAG: flagellar hook-length control protein FliK [Bdellovibrionales bacterium]